MTSEKAASDERSYLTRVHQEVKLARMMDQPVTLTWWLLGANILLWLAAKFYGIGLADQGLHVLPFNAEQIVFLTGMKVNAAIFDGQWWRLLSSQYVHLDVMHLAFNGYGIYVLGRFLERAYGLRRMLIIYTLSGTAGSLASFFFNPAMSGGASGAVYGLVGALIVFGVKYRNSLPPQLAKALTVGFLPWVVIGIGIGFIDGIPMDNAGHIGGIVCGAVLAFVMASRLRDGEGKKWTAGLLWTLTILVAAALVWMLAGWSEEVTVCLQSVEAYKGCYPMLF